MSLEVWETWLLWCYEALDLDSIWDTYLCFRQLWNCIIYHGIWRKFLCQISTIPVNLRVCHTFVPLITFRGSVYTLILPPTHSFHCSLISWFTNSFISMLSLLTRVVVFPWHMWLWHISKSLNSQLRSMRQFEDNAQNYSMIGTRLIKVNDDLGYTCKHAMITAVDIKF